MKRTELILSGMSIAVFALYLLGGVGMSLFMMLVLSLLSVLFGYFGFAHLNGIRATGLFKKESYKETGLKDIIVAIIGGAGIALIINSMLFAIMLWHGSKLFFITGFSLLSFALLIVVVMNNIRPLLKFCLVRRGVIFLILGVIFYLLPAYTWFSIRYRSQPEYVEASVNYFQNPTSENMKELDRVREEMLIREYNKGKE